LIIVIIGAAAPYHGAGPRKQFNLTAARGSRRFIRGDPWLQAET